ncbi:MAG TPA: hypothetical protein VLT82_02205 [Myxococcaceae bacterium]|nr:hypothetical protein [Myxococcaceae bacterium]
MKAVTLLAVLVPLVALADSPFDGTWVSKEESATMDKKPYVISLAKDVWSNQTAVPPIKIKADGTDQPVKGHAYYDTVSAKSSGPEAVEITSKKGGKVSGTSTFTVSADGKTLTQKWTDQTGTEVASGETVYERVAPAAAGAHAVSGSWKATKVQNLSASARTITYKSTADGISMTTPTGQSYTAKFDGKEVKVAGDPGGTTVALKKVNPNAFVETDHRGGKVVEVDHWTVAPDGKTMKVEWETMDTKRKGSYVLEKQ